MPEDFADAKSFGLLETKKLSLFAFELFDAFVGELSFFQDKLIDGVLQGLKRAHEQRVVDVRHFQKIRRST